MINTHRIIQGAMLIFAGIFFAGCASVQNYKYDIDSIRKHSMNQIVLIQKKLKEQKIMAEVTKRTNEMRNIFDKAELLFKEGELVKARELYKKAYKLSNNKFMTDHAELVNKELARQIRKDKKEEPASEVKSKSSDLNLKLNRRKNKVNLRLNKKNTSPRSKSPNLNLKLNRQSKMALQKHCNILIGKEMVPRDGLFFKLVKYHGCILSATARRVESRDGRVESNGRHEYFQVYQPLFRNRMTLGWFPFFLTEVKGLERSH
jgi:hypothetical protein